MTIRGIALYLTLIIGSAVLLTGCKTTAVAPIIVQNQMIVVTPPATLFNCPTIEQLPNPDTLTNLELANLIITLESNNRICASNMAGIKDYITRATKNLEQLNS